MFIDIIKKKTVFLNLWSVDLCVKYTETQKVD